MNIDTLQDIKALFEQKSVDTIWAFSHCKPSDTGKWTNSYHRYPAKFIPQLVEQLLEEYHIEKNALVNDPFYGSGTTLVSSLTKGLRVCGTDINKFSFLFWTRSIYIFRKKSLLDFLSFFRLNSKIIEMVLHVSFHHNGLFIVPRTMHLED